MSILDFFFPKKPASASIAKERLQIVLAHERASRDGPEFLPRMQKDLLAVVAKYVAIKDNMIRVTLGKTGDTSELRINVEFETNRRKGKAVVA